MIKTSESTATAELDKDELKRIVNAKNNALHLALAQSNSRVIEFEALALVDLQGIYLRLHEVLSGINFPIESGAVIGKLATLQINEVFNEIPRAIQKRCGSNVGILSDLFDEIKIETVGGKSYLAEQLRVIKSGTYLNVRPAFEVFYAIPPFDRIKWGLEGEARKGNREARSQLEKLKSGILRTSFSERDYKYYSDFVEAVKTNVNCRGSGQGFFTWGVGSKGVERFDEKEVDARITIRAMEALYEKHAEALCIVSSDQDFIPIKEKCEKFGVQFFWADAAKFMANARVGREIEGLSDNFIRGKLKPEWPLEILCDFIAPGEESGYWLAGIGEREARALASFHNTMNDYKVHIAVGEEGRMNLEVSQPLVSDVTNRIDGRTHMKQVLVSHLEY